MRRALVVSDFPIICATAVELFREQYDVVVGTWQVDASNIIAAPDLVVADITNRHMKGIFDTLFRLYPGASIVVFSLHRNEAAIYRPGADRPEMVPTLSSLLAVQA
ncbi:MAG: hypothetical protein NVSMB52_03280 [Chloroflexota bacterium]